MKEKEEQEEKENEEERLVSRRQTKEIYFNLLILPQDASSS